MKKFILSYSLIALFSLGMCVTSCSDDEVVSNESPVMRDYQTDARILSKFVDVNKSLGEYYINESKKYSPMDYISSSDLEELSKVSQTNRTRFENELKNLNSQLAMAAQDPSVSQIVYNTYGETWIREIDHNAPVKIAEVAKSSSIATRATYQRLQLLYNQEQWASFTAGNTIKSDISINMFGYSYYFLGI